MKGYQLSAIMLISASLLACKGSDDVNAALDNNSTQNNVTDVHASTDGFGTKDNPFSKENIEGADSDLDNYGEDFDHSTMASDNNNQPRSIIDKEKGMAAVEAGRRAVEAGIGAINHDEVKAIANELSTKAGKMAAAYAAASDNSNAADGYEDYSSYGSSWKKIEAKSTRVIDGDTVEILREGKQSDRIRLLGIDAPESSQAYGDKSTEELKKCIAGKPVSIVYENEDRYGRLLGLVMAGDVDCNYEQVKNGAAWHYKQYQKSQPSNHAKTYAQAEKSARANQIGLWQEPKPLEPWIYRRQN